MHMRLFIAAFAGLMFVSPAGHPDAPPLAGYPQITDTAADATTLAIYGTCDLRDPLRDGCRHRLEWYTWCGRSTLAGADDCGAMPEVTEHFPFVISVGRRRNTCEGAARNAVQTPGARRLCAAARSKLGLAPPAVSGKP